MNHEQLKEKLLHSLVVSIDGPAASGKTTTARSVAEKLGLSHIDTGAMYRAVTLKALSNRVDLHDGERLGVLASEAEIAFEKSGDGMICIQLDGRDVTDDVRSTEVTQHVSLVSAHPSVRTAMVQKQRRIADPGGVVLEGRDIGSVVLPYADVKVYLDASLEERASRRFKELREKGIDASLEALKYEIEKRDRFDSSRDTSPLKVPVGAYFLDTTELSIDEQVERVISVAEEKAGRLASLSTEGRERSDAEKVRALYRFGQLLLLCLLKLLWGIRIIRKDHLHYRENYIFASNHLSFSDPPLVGSTLPREVYFLAKEELFKNRVFAWLIRTFNAVPLKRSGSSREAIHTALDLLKEGKSILIFPEGTRVRGGKLGKPLAGAGYLALKSGVPVVPLYVRASNRLLACLVRRPRLVVVHGHPMRLTVEESGSDLHGEHYRAYSETVMEAIRALKDETG